MQDELTQSIRQLNCLAKRLRQLRTEAGSLTLSSAEVRFQLEHDSQDPVDVELKELKETNALVEEFMLLANISVAKRIHQSFPESAVLRRHPSPPQTNFDALKRALARFDISLSVDSSKQLADSLDQAVRTQDDYFNRLVRILTTRCMMQAVYYCSGTMPEHEFWHYGLAAPIYTHFTSPIRRYADVMVHRLLAASIGVDSAGELETTEAGEEKIELINHFWTE
jgi:exosome complex exonuclease DIS3/RRP44